MSRINQLLTCGVLAVAVTGCQSARNTTNQVMNWRPFNQSKVEELAKSQAELSDGVAAVDLGEDSSTKVEENNLAAQAKMLVTPSLEEDKPEVQQTASTLPTTVDQAVAEVTSPVVEQTAATASANSADDNSFAEFIRAMETQPSPSQSVASTETARELPVEAGIVAASESVIPSESTASVSVKTQEDLGLQVEALLAELQADPQKPTVEVPPVLANAGQHPLQSEIQQTALEQTHDAALVAYDLASFADSSVSKASAQPEVRLAEAIAKSAGQEKSDLSFEDWMKQSQNENAEPMKNESPAIVSTVRADFPWALPENIQEQTAALPLEIPSQQTSEQAVAKSSEKKAVVSNEMISALEAALGDPAWKSIESTAVGSKSQYSQAQNVASMMKHENHQIRLRGIRLAYEQRKLHPELLDLVAVMLDDKNDSVRAHAASTLYHSQRANPAVVSTLAEIVCSGDVAAAHLSAMFLGDMVNLREEVLPALKTSLLSTSGLTSMYVADSLLKHDPKSVDAVACLTNLMRHENIEVRWLTAHALGSVQGSLQPYAVEALRSGLRDIDPQIRATSALSLGGLGQASKPAVAELTFISAHAEEKVKDAAIIALECIQQ